MDNEIRFELLEIPTMEVLKGYTSLREVYDDFKFKAPESFWIGVVELGQAFTIPQFNEMYKEVLDVFKASDK